MPQIEKPDDLQAIASLIRFFCMHDKSPSVMEMAEKSPVANLNEILTRLVEQHCI